MTRGQDRFEQLTPPGEGGIAVFGLAGPGVRAALSAAVDSRRIASLSPGELAYGRLLDGDGRLLDEVIVACLPPRNDGERFELNCHAGGAAADAASRRLAELGLLAERLPPEPGESSLTRDFRVALGALRTRRQAAALADARSAIHAELGRILQLLDSPGDWSSACAALGEILAESERLGELLAVHRAVLFGPANAGKSTLFNRLVGADRAITSPHPGTTRDTVEATVALRGLAVTLVDTAGLGDGLGRLAGLSQELSREAAGGADLVLLVLDGGETTEPRAQELPAGLLDGTGKSILIRNKTDAASAPPPPGASIRGAGPPVDISALTGEGVPELIELIERALLPSPPAGGAAIPAGECLARLRQGYACAQKASVENDPSAARKAAAILERLREKPV